MHPIQRTLMFILCSKCSGFLYPFFIGVRFIGIKLAVVRTLMLQSTLLSSKNLRFRMIGVPSDKRNCSGEKQTYYSDKLPLGIHART